MTAHLLPHYGPHTIDPILGRRPLAYPGIYATQAAAAAGGPCDWFDALTPEAWQVALGSVTWLGAAGGGWRALESALEWKSQPAGGWRQRKPCA